MRAVFDRFAFDSDRRELLAGSDPVHLGPKAFQLLEILIANRPRPIRKEELYESIWTDAVVDESNLAGLVKELRAALGDDARQPRFIRTVHGFGYAFCGERHDAAFVLFKDRQLPLHEGVNILGRDASNDVQIDDSPVSRKHASIEIRGDHATIEDLDSKNGTFVDGAKIAAPTPLEEGQAIVLGDASMVFRRSAFASTLTVAR
ncbi:MAG TPA: FHA domain-containing protein, partial [Thermoanaerobaculia bacterium]|nr:FHA domain-containing protein [Thermoanaerobaculia bacterium]